MQVCPWAPGGLHPLSSYSSQEQTSTSRVEMKPSSNWIDWERPVHSLGHLTMLCSNTFPHSTWQTWKASWIERPSADHRLG